MGERTASARVVIVGAGFGGLYCARTLAKNSPEARITLIDRRNHHLFQPLLYQVATAGLSPGEIAHPIRTVLRGLKNVRVLLGEAVRVDLAGRRVILRDGDIGFDYLVLATGAAHTYFGHDEWALLAPGLKTLEDALEIRRRILLAFEKAEREPDTALRRGLLTFVVVGGGPTGVELAGAIAEIARRVMVQDFRAIDPREARIVLVEAGPRILATFPEDLASWSANALERMGVEIRTGAPVTTIRPGYVVVGSEELRAANVLWAAGVKASEVARSLMVPLDRAGRVQVESDCSVPGHPEAFVIGDLAAMKDVDGKMLPGVAPVAIQQGRHVARQIARSLREPELPREPFRYKDRGTLATIGTKAAIAVIGGLKLRGFIAWVVWLFVHILWLIGFRNRAAVMLNWAWSYVTFERAARLITGDPENLVPESSATETRRQ